MATVAPQLEVFNGLEPHAFVEPTKRIASEADLERFKWTQGWSDIGQFIVQLNRALCPRRIPVQAGDSTPSTSTAVSPDAQQPTASMVPPSLLSLSRGLKKTESTPTETFTINSKREDPPSVKQLQAMLEKLKSFIDEAPPSTEPRRFGNVSFRIWHKLVEDRADALLQEFLPRDVLDFQYIGDVSPLVELRAYFLGSFGSSTRLDYGTGHELSFLAFLGCLWKLGGFKDGTGGRNGDIERSIVFGVFEPYLNLMRKLILTYTLEPAGSHGVWGLDDHFFLPYIFGSAQLTRPIDEDGDEPMPQEGSVRGAPKPADICRADQVARHRGDNMYFSAVGFINDVKRGPFWEHSPVLYNVSGIKDGWGKINKGMVKMFVAEVLGKFPVVQHFPFGSLFAWDLHPTAPPEPEQPVQAPANNFTTLPTAAPPGSWPGTVRPPVGSFPRPGVAAQGAGSLPRPLARPPPPGVYPTPGVEKKISNWREGAP